MSDFINWLESLDQRRTVLVEVDYLNEGSSGTLNLANRPFISKTTDVVRSTPYDDVILGGLTYGRRMGGQVSGALGLSVGSIDLAASPDIVVASGYEFAGQEVRVYLGDQRWVRDDFQLVAVLTAESLVPTSRTQYSLKFRTERLDLNEPLNNAVFISGPNIDAFKPVCLGDCFNIRPVQVDDAGLVWAVHDGAVAFIGDVRVDGAIVSATKNTATGTITLSSKPTGTLTADVIGAGGIAVKEILTEILSRLGGVQIDTVSLDALPTDSVGLYGRSGISYRQAFDALLKNFGGFWGFTRLNIFKAGRIIRSEGGSAALLTPDDIILDGVAFDRRIRPASAVDLKYRKNYTTQNVNGYGEGFSTVRKENADITYVFPDAELKETETLLSLSSSAEAEAERRRIFYSTPLKIYTVNAFALPFAYEIGQEIRLIYPYFEMENGVDAIVLSIKDDPLQGVTQLKVLIDG